MKEEKKKKKLSKAGKVILDIILIVAICVAGYSGYHLYIGLKDYHDGKKEYDSLKPEVIHTAKPSNDSDTVQIDWDKLRSINPDIAAWIQQDNSVIDYPVVYTTDNDYYLNHLFDGTWNHSGCVFIDKNNSHGFKDQNTVMYAHHRFDGTMFHSVEDYKDQSYYESHKEFHIYTPDGNYIMYPVAGILTTGSSDYVRYTFTDDNDFLSYVDSFVKKSTFKGEKTIEAGDQTLMLSTCSDVIKDGRYALIGKLVKESDAVKG